MIRISALSLPFRRPHDFQQFSEHATFVSICNSCPHTQHVSFSIICPHCTICLHMQHLPAPAQFYRLRSDFLLPPQAFPQRFSVSWTPASSSRYSDGLALQLVPYIFSLLQLVASSSIFRLMLFPHLPIYVRAFRGPVGACVRLCLGDSSRPALPRQGVRAAVELTA